MPKGRPLTLYEREKIETWLRMRKEKTWIAGKLNRDYSIIKREIKRNSGECLPYVAAVADKLARQRARKTNVRKLDKANNLKLKEFVDEKLENDYSPEQISGILKEYTQKIFQKQSATKVFTITFITTRKRKENSTST